MIAERSTRKIVGVQLVGGEEITGRVNWVSAAIMSGKTVDEFDSGFENAYCPPTSMVKDVVNNVANDLLNKM